ncbi:MAG: transposase [Polyangiaceae bacterium]|nr:transposase [Polyangiaceae bacterium]
MAKRRIRRVFTEEFKAKAVKQCTMGERGISGVARALDLSASALRAWVKQAKVDAGEGAPGELTTEERAELSRFGRENRQLKQDRDILEAAATFFAK